MVHVTIYTKPYCPYCLRAVSLLEKKGVDFTELDAAFDPDLRREMMQRWADYLDKLRIGAEVIPLRAATK